MFVSLFYLQDDRISTNQILLYTRTLSTNILIIIYNIRLRITVAQSSSVETKKSIFYLKINKMYLHKIQIQNIFVAFFTINDKLM